MDIGIIHVCEDALLVSSKEAAGRDGAGGDACVLFVGIMSSIGLATKAPGVEHGTA
jgi:hypothetical protein